MSELWVVASKTSAFSLNVDSTPEGTIRGKIVVWIGRLAYGLESKLSEFCAIVFNMSTNISLIIQVSDSLGD